MAIIMILAAVSFAPTAAASQTNYAKVDASLTITIPAIEYEGACYQILLNYYVNSADPSNLYWVLDMNSIGISQGCGSDSSILNSVNLQITIPCIEYEGSLFQIVLDYYSNPIDPSHLYWKLNSVTIINNSSSLTASPWPMFGHDAQHTGRSPYVGVQATESNLKWYTSVSNVADNEVHFSDITMGSDGLIYALAGYASTNKVYAIDINTGSSKWAYHPKFGSYGITAYGPPTVGKDGTVYIVDEDAFIHAINPSDGSFKWKTSITYCGYYSDHGPMTIADDGTIYLPCSVLSAYNPDGSFKWTYDPSGPFNPYTYVARLSPAIGTDGTIYMGVSNNNDSTERGLVAINSDGNFKWRFSVSTTPLLSPAIGPDGTIYFGVYSYFYAINPDSSLKWKLSRSGSYYSVSIPSIASDGTIYLVDGGILYAFDPSDGSTRWQLSISDFSTYGLPTLTIDANGTIYLGTIDYLYAINPDGTVKWSFFVSYSAHFSSPKIGSDGSLYVQDVNGVKAFGP